MTAVLRPFAQRLASARRPPCIERDGFLPVEIADQLLSVLLDGPASYRLAETQARRHTYIRYDTRHPSGFADGIDGPLHVSSLATEGPADYLKRLVIESVPSIAADLGIHFEAPSIACAALAYNDGSFFIAHRDNVQTNYASRLSFNLYLHRRPKAFDGGELLVYSRTRRPRVAHRTSPGHNRIVFFPSDTLHEVLPVRCPSQDFSDCRFAITGWISGP